MPSCSFSNLFAWTLFKMKASFFFRLNIGTNRLIENNFFNIFISGSEIHFESVKNIDRCILAIEYALTESIKLCGWPGQIPKLWHNKGITDGLLAINVLGGKKTSKWKFYLFGPKTDKQTKSKTRNTNLRAGPNRTLNRSSESERIFHEFMNLSDFGLKVL